MKKSLLLIAATSFLSLGAADIVIDRYGQFAKLNFPEKVTSDEQLKADIEADKAYYASFTPPKRTFWGGLPGSKEKYNLTATGFFHLEKVPALNNRELLVDPEGNLYFHIGMCSTQPGNEFTRVTGREQIYEWIPGEEGEFKPARLGVTASFYIANWIRKFGSFDRAQWQSVMLERCRQLGFNSHAAFTSIFGDNLKYGFAITPCIERFQSTQPFRKINEKFIDPFDEYNFPLLEKAFERVTKRYKGKPEVIGYYTENETFYTTVLSDLFRNTSGLKAKQKFADLMKERYNGDISAFNRNWKTQFKDFNDIVSNEVNATTTASSKDAADFEELFFETYYKLVKETLNKLSPGHLFLGERFLMGQTHNTAVMKAMGKYCDIFSINYYTAEFSHEDMERLYNICKRPLLLSEWSYGANTQGLYGVQTMDNQDERGKAYRRYAENAAASPYVIGHQYFALLDESNTGRGWENFDGERFNLGIVNVCDRPYKDFLKHVSIANNNTYDVIEGKVQPPALSSRKAIKAEKFVMPIGKVKANSVVDGDRAKYPGRPGTVISRSVEGKNVNSADIICGWDAEYFYILYTVPDSTPATNDHKRHICLGDGIEMFFGADLTTSGRMQQGDRQLLIRANQYAQPQYAWSVNGGDLKKALEPKRLCKISTDRKGWSMEVAVPWAELGITPAVGVKFRFDTAIVLSTDRIDERGDKLVWNGLEENYCCRDYWGTVVLED